MNATSGVVRHAPSLYLAAAGYIMPRRSASSLHRTDCWSGTAGPGPLVGDCWSGTAGPGPLVG
eukprot:7378810-Prymnesium_polylepis.3